MIRLDLTDDEVERLRALCTETLSDLRMEIVGTDSLDFREGLKKDAAFLRRLLERLTPLDAPAARS